MKILITGGTGFIGSHLADFLVSKGFKDVYVECWSGETVENVKHLGNMVKLIKFDIRDSKKVREVIAKIRPDLIFHLAAQSYVTESWKHPKETLETNILGTFNLFDSTIKERINPVIISVCSSAEYGITERNEIPINENKKFRPISPYAVSKVAQDMLSLQYHKSHDLKIIRTRLFNTVGPRKRYDACSDFANGIAEVERGISNCLKVGNLDGIRDFTDVGDAVKALWLLYEKGKAGEVYNVCSGKGIRIGDVVKILKGMAKSDVKVKKDKSKMRIIDDPLYIGDNKKIRSLGWEPEIPIEKTLLNILNYWRGKINGKE
ncbi:MAG: GDP-mannose 4,6-dehydratase [Candidatus Aenigmarchaeota archaeon]|nr:GDP-mannose 4,6-dehydratase [Candidatus Aenigmarchaeota archaeon]